MTELSQECMDPTSPNLARTRAIIVALHFCFRFWISCCIFKCGQLKVGGVLKDAKSHFRLPVKIRGGVSKFSLPIVEALSTTEPLKYI